MKKIVVWIFAFLLSCNAWAQTTHVDDLGNNLSYKEISIQLQKIEDMTKADKVDLKALVDKTTYLNKIFVDLTTSRQNIDGEVRLIEKRLNAIGEKEEGSEESRLIAQKRKEFSQDLTVEKTRLSEIDILLAKIEELNLKIFEARNQRIWGRLLKGELCFVNPTILWNVNRQLVNLLVDIIKSPYSAIEEYKDTKQEGFGLALFKFFALMAVIAVLGYYLRKFIIEHWGYRKPTDNLRLSNKIRASIAVWCAYGIIPTAIVLYCWYHLNQIAFWSNDLLNLVLHTSLYYILVVIMGRAIARVILTPYNEKWRLIKMSTIKAKRLFMAINFMIYTVGIFSILLTIVAKLGYSDDLLLYLMALTSSLRAVCMVWLCYIYFTSDTNDEDDESEEALNAKTRASRIGVFVTMFACGVIVLSFCGYTRLAFFIVNRILVSLIAVLAYTILRRWVYDVARRVFFMSLWVKNFRVGRLFLRKVDFWFGLIIEPLIMLVLIVGLFILWGMPVDVLQNIIYKAISGFTVGGVKVSLISIFWGVLVFALCLWVIRFLQNRIEFKILERTNIDNGTKHSLASGFAYIGYVLSGLLAIAIMGGNLSNIALIAGALSVGIGLGLQDIVNNFVSGIIMLFERPIKVGDWVVINGEEGQVKQINIRSTEIETFARSSIIIPNSKVLSNAVTSLTHQNNWARYGVKVGVAYGTDVEKVKKVLLECVASHPKVAKKPAPYVLFQDFGSSSLDFEVRFYVSDVWGGWTTPSDVRFIINKRFEEEGIEIPFTQLVLHQAKD